MLLKFNTLQYQNQHGLHIQQVYLVHLLVFLLYKQLDIFLEKGYDIKEKLVVFGCLGKGEQKSITSDHGTSIC